MDVALPGFVTYTANAQRDYGNERVWAMRASERALRRLREELDERGITQRQLADELTSRTGRLWTQSKAGKLLRGRVSLRVDEMAAVAELLNLPLTEIVRDRSLEFCAEMTPSEVRLLERVRMKPHLLQAMFVIMGEAAPAPSQTVLRPIHRKVGRPRHSEVKAKNRLS